MSNSNTDAFDMTLLGTLDPGELFEYCERKGPNKIAEKYIAKKAYWSFYYAEEIIKGRFELGEKAIATDASFSFDYAADILDDRFILGEPTIKRSIYKKDYEDYFDVKL